MKYNVFKRKWTMMLIAMLFTLTACSQNASYSDDTKILESEKKDITLEFWTINLSPNFDDYINGRIKKFEDENPGIKIKWLDVPFEAIENKLLLSIASGNSPDVVNLNTEMALKMASKGVLVDLNKEATEDQRNIYFEGLYQSTVIGDSAYAFPWYVAPQVLMYNKKFYQEAGLDPNQPPQTYDELKEQAQKIKEKTGKYALVPTFKVIAELKFAGVPLVSEDKTKAIVNTPEALQFAEWVLSLYKEGLAPKDAVTEGSMYNYNYALNQYQGGELAMLITGPQFLNRIKQNAKDVYDNTLVAKAPVNRAGKVVAPLMNVVVPKLSKHHKEAIAFANFITNDESQLEFSKIVTIFPSTKKAAQDPFFTQSGDDPESKARVLGASILPQAVDFTLGIPREKDLYDAFFKEWDKMLLEKQSPEETLKKIEDNWQALLDEINKQY